VAPGLEEEGAGDDSDSVGSFDSQEHDRFVAGSGRARATEAGPLAGAEQSPGDAGEQEGFDSEEHDVDVMPQGAAGDRGVAAGGEAAGVRKGKGLGSKGREAKQAGKKSKGADKSGRGVDNSLQRPKNRMGQHARRALAEKKFGRRAKHLAQQVRSSHNCTAH
jgi:hypothetical protein